jgi:hypothetical protein
MAPRTYAIVRQAIIDRHQILATYHGHRREMCPHVIGATGGRRQALFFQFGGTSESGLPWAGEWRCMRIDDLTDVSSRPGQWYTGADHSRPQTCVHEVDIAVDFGQEPSPVPQVDGW